MNLDLTNLETAHFPSVHAIGCRALKMFHVYYLNVYDIQRLVTLEFACRVDEDIRNAVFDALTPSGYRSLEINADDLLFIEAKLHDKIEELLDDYCDGVQVGTRDGGEDEDDIINAIERKTMLLTKAFASALRYEFAGAYAVTLCKVNTADTYVIKLSEVKDEYDKNNPRKEAQKNVWLKDFKVSAGFTFLWLGKQVRFDKVVFIEIKKEG